MIHSKLGHYINELNPKQPEFVLATSDYQKRILPDHNLAHFYHFKAEYDKMKVVPDACIDILFWNKDGKVSARVAGSLLANGYTQIDKNCDYFGIRFMPGINPVSQCIKFTELINNEEDFELMIEPSQRERLMEKMYFAKTFDEKITIFMNYYFNRDTQQPEDSKSLKHVLRDAICSGDGNIKLDDLCNYTGYSQRYLNTKINEYFGINPKNLIRIIRFQKSVTNLTKAITHINCIDTALESGYYDQSHFNKEFKCFTGVTPKTYIDNLICNSYDKKLHILN